VALRIYWVGRSVPIRSYNPNKFRVKIQLLTRIVCFGPVWPVRPGCRSSERHNFLIWTPNWTFHICISIVSTRSTQWCSPIDNLTNLSWQVSPDCPENLNRANFGCQHMPPCFLIKLACQETSLKAQTALKQCEAPTHQSCLLQGRYCISAMSSCVNETSLSIHYLGCESCSCFGPIINIICIN